MKNNVCLNPKASILFIGGAPEAFLLEIQKVKMSSISTCMDIFTFCISRRNASGALEVLFMANRWGNSGNSGWLYFGGLQNHSRWWMQPWNLKMLAPWKKSYDQPRQHIKKQRHYFVNKCPSIQSYGFSSSHVWRWELDYKESWVPQNWCFWTVVLAKTLENPLDSKEIQLVHPKGNQSWIFIGRTDVGVSAST